MPKTDEMIPLADALAIADRVTPPAELAVETIDVRLALGRVLAADQKSLVDLPAFDKSAMDGYAVMAGDERDEYRLLETVPAGCVATQPLVPGATIKVMTGAPVPDGAGKVIMVERTAEADGVVRIHTPDKAINICKQGEDVRCGDVILQAPTVLDAAAIANLVSCGVTEAPVARRLRVSILSTGDEIVDSAADLAPGKIMNSNGPMLAALCEQFGLAVVNQFIVPDDRNGTIAAIEAAMSASDIVLVSGGVSVGDFDFVAYAMTELSLTVHFDRVAIKPGKPITLATGPAGIVFGLPGNPVSAYVMFHLFVRRAARLIAGLPREPRHISLPLAADYRRRKTDRLAYVLGRLTAAGAVEQVECHGSAHLQAVLASDGLFVVPRGTGQFQAGDRVDFLPTRGDMA